MDKSPFSDNNVRMAMKLAMDRGETNEKSDFNAGTVGNDFHFSPKTSDYTEWLEQRVHDPDKAKWHLKQAGMDSLEANMWASDSVQPGAVDFVTLYAEQAEAAGINITPVRESGDGHWADVWLKKPFMFSSCGGRPTPDVIFSLTYQTGAAWSEAFRSNARFDELLLPAKAELDVGLRAEKYRETCMIARDDGGSIVPHFTNYVYAHLDTIGRPDVVGNTWEFDGAFGYQRCWFKS
ncbi:MAG: ABC transporter substrate-binding protein [Pseudomonadota bacterium]